MQHYSVIFNTTNGSRRSIRINNPDTDLPTPQIQAAVDQMLANDIFDPATSGLDSLNRMELTRVERTDIL